MSTARCPVCRVEVSVVLGRTNYHCGKAFVPVTPTQMLESKACEVIVDFGKAVPPDIQGLVLMTMERTLREAGVPAHVFKRTMLDDSKLRLRMTEEERQKL